MLSINTELSSSSYHQINYFLQQLYKKRVLDIILRNLVNECPLVFVDNTYYHTYLEMTRRPFNYETISSVIL